MSFGNINYIVLIIYYLLGHRDILALMVLPVPLAPRVFPGLPALPVRRVPLARLAPRDLPAPLVPLALPVRRVPQALPVPRALPVPLAPLALPVRRVLQALPVPRALPVPLAPPALPDLLVPRVQSYIRNMETAENIHETKRYFPFL